MLLLLRVTKKAEPTVPVKPLEIDVGAVHHIVGPGLDVDPVERMDIVHLAIGNMDECWDIAMQVEQRVHLDGGLVPAEFGPGKQREAEIDGGRIERVEAGIEINATRYRRHTAARAMPIKCCAKSAKMRQSCVSLASASVERAMLRRKPR